MTIAGRKARDGHALGVRLLVAGLTLVAASPAPAGWEDDFGTLRIGMVSPSGDRGVAGLNEMTTAFEMATGVPSEILVARDYPALIRAIAEERVHYAIYSATAYAAAELLCGCVEPVAAPLGVDGAVGVRAVLVGRQHPHDAEAVRVAAGPAEALGPQSLALAGLGETRFADRGAAIVHAASFADAERAFLAGEAELLIGWEPVYDTDGAEAMSGTLARLAAAGPQADDVTVLWSSDTLAYGPHTVRSDLPDELKQRLGRFLVNLRDQQPDVYEFLEPHRGGGFVRTEAGKYAAAREIAAKFAGGGAD